MKPVLRRHLPLPKTVARRQANKRVMMKFAETMGMVYFGKVDANAEDAQLVRGLTVSGHHRDRNYTVGSLYGYDIACVERTDTIRFPGKPASEQHWLIMQFDLHTTTDLPHLFVGLHTHSSAFYETLFAKFSRLQRAHLGVFGAYDKAFMQRYAVYTSPSGSLTVERLFDDAMVQTVLKHFGTLTFEIHDRALYVYSENKRVTAPLLDAILKNGIWLARHIDERADRL